MTSRDDDHPRFGDPRKPSSATKGKGVIKGIMAIYFLVCALILLTGIAILYSVQPEKFEWSFEDVLPATLSEYELGADHWQWHPPGATCELLNLARADFHARKRFIDLGLSAPHRGYQCYYRFRIDDPEFAARLEAAPKRRLITPGRKQGKQEFPEPPWWNPTESVSIEVDGDHEIFFLNPEEAGIAFGTRGWEWGD